MGFFFKDKIEKWSNLKRQEKKESNSFTFSTIARNERYDINSIIDQGSFVQRSPKFIMAATTIVNVRNRVTLKECPQKMEIFHDFCH